jgi:DNA repair exonuclease SbcCD ATPase subunit
MEKGMEAQVQKATNGDVVQAKTSAELLKALNEEKAARKKLSMLKRQIKKAEKLLANKDEIKKELQEKIRKAKEGDVEKAKERRQKADSAYGKLLKENKAILDKAEETNKEIQGLKDQLKATKVKEKTEKKVVKKADKKVNGKKS